MRFFYIGFILFIFFHLPVGAQEYAPTGILNSYTFTEKDGVENSNYSCPYISTSGKVYTSPYGVPQIQIIGNNYSRIIIDNINKPLDVIDGFTETADGEIWAFQNSQVSILRNDTLIRSIKYPNSDVLVSVGSPNFLESESRKSIYYFDGFHFTKIFSNVNFPDSGELRIYLNDESVYFYCQAMHAIHIYKIKGTHEKQFVKSLENKNFKLRITELIKTDSNWYVFANDHQYIYNDFSPQKSFPVPQFLATKNKRVLNLALTKDGTPKTIFSFRNDKIVPVGNIDIIGKAKVFEPDIALNFKAFYANGGLQPARAFMYIKKYPAIYNKTNSSEIFSLAQDFKNRIWAASYQGSMSIIAPDNITEVPVKNLHFLSGSVVADDKLLFFAEGNSMCSLLFNSKGTIIKKDIHFGGFIGYILPNKKDVYIGMGQYKGLWHTQMASLSKGNPIWDTIGKSKGVYLNNILALTSDTLDRIWFGQRGFGVYDPRTGFAKTFNKGIETNLHIVSLHTDTYGTVWLGSSENGLLYYETYSDTVRPSDLRRINHPLLPDKNRINSLCVWSKWLVIGIEEKVLLLDLQKWHKDKSIIIRYLNPQEATFTSKVEQNIFLIDKRDSTLWFSTSDMLYQWDIKTWLTLPVYKVTPNLVMRNGKNEFSLYENQQIKVEPTRNTFSLEIWFQSRDNMPRYMTAALISRGDSISYPNPSLQTQFDYSNLAPETYFFAVKIFQSDGTTSTHTYTIVVKKFWWQYAWVWVFFALIVLTPIVLWLNGLRKTALLKKIKAEQESKLANLQLVSLSSQFRPHFILNALNAIGAGSEDKPEQESILSRLGESVNLIFNHAKEQKTTHTFSNEWKLAINVIEIHRLMYLKELQLTLPSQALLNEVSNIQVPLGLMQIPVENALLHGLNNRLVPPWILNIDIELHPKYVNIIISDNGVGRPKSATLSNFTKHGTGSKNLHEVVRILNENSENKIDILYKDNILEDAAGNYGTQVIIQIPKTSLVW